MIRTIAAVVSLSILAGCALTEKQCLEGNWRGIGLNDGKNGLDLDHVANHVKACSKHGVSVDEELWSLGRDDGLKIYCTPGSAYEQEADGRSFKIYNCPSADHVKLVHAADQGERYYNISQRIADLDRKRSSLYDDLASLPSDPSGAIKRSAIQLKISAIDFEIRQLILDRSRYSRY